MKEGTWTNLLFVITETQQVLWLPCPSSSNLAFGPKVVIVCQISIGLSFIIFDKIYTRLAWFKRIKRVLWFMIRLVS